ncbi:hypothetical protein RA28_19640 [Ruegeria sp. ANG-S4]|uniref:hypothetical protein n=1 Tax=Ruegeria sp. ANG-S4 TaxID=1577904 RepID=UPI00057CBE1A|nr:hypothetical protein [Ruegeria sp. ANG-S4]KIC43840.1 hypothetical protein RA28_19640 [Ruegeria sp. ANG-S4]
MNKPVNDAATKFAENVRKIHKPPPATPAAPTIETVGKAIGAALREERADVDKALGSVEKNLRQELEGQRAEIEKQIAALDDNRLAKGATTDLARGHLKAIISHCESIMLRKSAVVAGSPPKGMGVVFCE